MNLSGEDKQLFDEPCGQNEVSRGKEKSTPLNPSVNCANR